MKIAALQMVSTPDVARNLDTAARIDRPGRAQRCRVGGAARVLLPARSTRHRQAGGGRGRRRRTDPAPAGRLCAARQGVGGGRHVADAHGRSPACAQQLLRVCARRPARRALRQDSPVRLRQRPRALRRRPRARGRHAPRWRSRPWACASACRCATTCGFPSCIARSAIRRATCCACRRRSPTPPGSRTGSCCCARGRSRTSAT